MPERPLVSVIITNYNYGRYLRRAIDSALRQTYRPLEILVVDDGSTDESRAVIESYGNSIRALFRANGGNAAAYNTGFTASLGDILLFLDADDGLYPDAVATVVGAWTPQTSKAQFYLDVVDVEERPLGRWTPNLPFLRGGVLSCLFAYGYYPSAPASGNAYSRAFLASMMPVEERAWQMGVDGLLNGLAALAGEIVSIERPLGFYRHHDCNHSEASGASLPKIRRDLLNEVNREAALRGRATALGRQVPAGLSLRIPGHCKGRLLSLRLAPALHPFRDDRRWRLVAHGIHASWRFPHHGLGKRLGATIGFLGLAVLPVAWLEAHLDLIIVAERRPEWLRGPRTGIRRSPRAA